MSNERTRRDRLAGLHWSEDSTDDDKTTPPVTTKESPTLYLTLTYVLCLLAIINTILSTFAYGFTIYSYLIIIIVPIAVLIAVECGITHAVYLIIIVVLVYCWRTSVQMTRLEREHVEEMLGVCMGAEVWFDNMFLAEGAVRNMCVDGRPG
ncbi:hypothetical protein NX059_011399 [Plenodomus lindquistii]|nr:hypothetical protein NX059_011399 [Plenodomus lindquistii]